jgi:hypothetical protein
MVIIVFRYFPLFRRVVTHHHHRALSSKGRRKKPFIDKKNAVTFRLEPADIAAMRERQDEERDPADDYDRREWELAELGLPNDGYDYFQHLRDAGQQFMSTLPAEATVASTAFVPENVTVYKRGVDAIDEMRMSVPASRIRVKDVAQLDHATFSALDVDNNGVIVADADTEIDLDIIHALHNIEEEQLEELGDDFFLLANDGLVGGPQLTKSRLSAAAQANARAQARADARREMLEDLDDDDDGDEDDDDGEFYSEDDFDNDGDDDDDDDDDDNDDDGELPRIDPNERLSPRSRRARSERYAHSVAESGVYQRSEAGKSMRSVALQELDAHFEKFEKQYDADEIGDLEDQADDITGDRDLLDMLQQLEVARKVKKKNEFVPLGSGFADDDAKDAHNQESFRLARAIMAQPERPLADARPMTDKPKLEQWDAESYTSLFSTTEHHPSVVGPPPRNTKSRAAGDANAAPKLIDREQLVRFKLSRSGVALAGIPMRGDALKAGKATDETAAVDESDEAKREREAQALMNTRDANETKEQKAARKSAVKAARAEARARKKVSRISERAATKQMARAAAHVGPHTAVHM